MNLTSTLTGNGWDVDETTGGTPVIQRNGQGQPIGLIDPDTGLLVGTGSGSVAVQDEGTQVASAAARLNFRGAGVTASSDGAGGVNVDVPGVGGSPVVIALTVDRALTTADHRANLAITANRSVTVGVGGIEPHFINSTGAPLTLTFAAAAGSGVVINGTANGSVTRTIPARGVFTPRADADGSYDVPDPQSPRITVVTPIYEYDDAGNVRRRAQVRPERILKQGQLLWWPSVPTSTAAISYAAYAGPALLLSGSTTQNPLEITYTNGGFSSTSFSGLNIAPPSDGLMQLMLWVPDWENSDPNPLAGSLQIDVGMANGTSASFVFSTTAVRPGWNTIQLWNPLDADQQGTFNRAGVSNTTGTPTITYSGTTISSISIRANNPAAGSKIRVGGLYSQTVVKPMFVMTFDTSNPDVFDNFAPAWRAAGLTASFRAGGNNAYRDAQFYSGGTFREKARAQYNAGFDIYNGSWSRANVGGLTEAQFAAEVGLQTNWQNSAGLQRGNVLFSTAGNGLPKASIYRKVFPQFGVSLAKTSSGVGRIRTIGPAGLDDRLAITSTGWSGRSAGLRDIRVLQQAGGILLYFAHQCEVAGAEPPPDTGSPGSGGGMYQEDAVFFAAHLRTLQAAGAVDVVSASQLAAILDGEM